MGTPRQRILDTAAGLFYRHGAPAVGVDLVSQAAGVSKRTLYQQFRSKDELIAETLDAQGEAILGLYLPARESAGAPRDLVLAVFGRLRDLFVSEGFRGCPFVNTATELPDPEHPARRVARNYKLRMRDFFADQAELGQANDPQLLADQLMIVFDGAMVQAVMGTLATPDAATATAAALLDAHGVH